jgi:hypothetical protein
LNADDTDCADVRGFLILFHPCDPRSFFMELAKRIKRLRLRTKIFLGLLLAFLIWFAFCLPRKLFNEPTSFVLEDKDGNLLGATVSDDGQWRFPEMRSIPEKYPGLRRQAFLQAYRRGSVGDGKSDPAKFAE